MPTETSGRVQCHWQSGDTAPQWYFGCCCVIAVAGDLDDIPKTVEGDIKRLFDMGQIVAVMPIEIGQVIIIFKFDLDTVAFVLATLVLARPVVTVASAASEFCDAEMIFIGMIAPISPDEQGMYSLHPLRPVRWP